MEDVIDLIATDSSASEISDRIKDILYSKAAERIDSLRPVISNSIFGGQTDSENEVEPEED